MKWDEKIAGLLREKKIWWLAGLVLAAALFLSGGQESMTQEEKRISQALSQMEGAGRVQVTIYYSENTSAFGGAQTCVGALALCEGAGDIRVRLQVTQALETLLGLGAQDVVVLKMEQKR